MKRAPGTGSVTELEPGRFWARMYVDGKRKSFGVHPTEEIAQGILDAALNGRSRQGGATGSKLTFLTFGRQVLDIREGDGMRNVEKDRNLFHVHLENSDLADKAVDAITSADIAAFLRVTGRKFAADSRGRRRIATNTVRTVKVLVSCIFNEAVEQGKRSDNPCIRVRMKRREEDDAEGANEKWDWLRGAEQRAVFACPEIPEWGRLLMRFAWGAGLRQGEQWHLLLSDVHFARPEEKCACGAKACPALEEHGPHVFVRYGSNKGGKARTPKAKKTRRTPLFGEALAAITRWLEVLPTYAPANPLGLVFPGPSGARRPKGPPAKSSWEIDKRRAKGGKVVKNYLLPVWLKAAGIPRHVRWHDLRHTCASSLVSGTWGRKWSLDEVCKMLGHSSIKVTERYAHLCDTALREAAAATGYATVTTPPETPPEPTEKPNDSEERRGSDSNRRMTVLQGQGKSSNIRELTPPVTPASPQADRAKALLEAIAAGDSARIAALAVTVAADTLTQVPYKKEQTG